ncbi:NAD(P)-binding protein [Clavulina sp. PMI_390]|nr:NAD(P)-binding protein [Clavulina sp. PMI_390]
MAGVLYRLYMSFYPPCPPKEANPIKFGILGASSVATYALLTPVKSHPGVVVEGVAARDYSRAKAFAKSNSIPKAYATYEELLEDPSIDAVYIALTNSHHYEWATKSLHAGKHVLVEKPMTTSSADAAKLFALAKERNLIVMEANHIRFHPTAQTMKALVDSGRIGNVQGIDSTWAISSTPPNVKKTSLGGGAMVCAGCYPVSLARYILDGADATDVRLVRTKPFPDEKQSDQHTYVECDFTSPSDGSLVTALLSADMALPQLLPPFKWTLKIQGDEGTLYLNNYFAPSIFHTITITERPTDANGKSQETISYVKAYSFKELDPKAKGEDWWTTYRYQLEAFIDKINGRQPQTWVDEAESVGCLAVLDRAYEVNGFGARATTNYKE